MLDRVSPKTFHDLLSDVIRVNMPWQEMDSWRVHLQVISDRQELAELHLPWYRRQDEQELWQGDIQTPDPADPPVPLQIKDSEQFLSCYNRRRRDAILRLTRNYRVHKYTQTLLAPAAQLPDGRRILLDGCHRLSALWLSEVPFSVALLTIEGDPNELHLTDMQRLAERRPAA